MNTFEGQYWQGPDGQPAIGSTITFSSDQAGTQPIQCYDLQGNPITLTTGSNPPGWMPQFQADAQIGWLSAGGQALLRLAMQYLATQVSSIDDLQQQIANASSDASSAAALAASANATASQAQTATNPLTGDSGIAQSQLDAV